MHTMTTQSMGPRERTRPRIVERHIATDYARDTVAKAFYEVILDGVEYGPRDLPTSRDREWIRGAIAMPIHEATELALHDLARRLAVALKGAPDGLLDRHHSSHEGVERGSESGAPGSGSVSRAAAVQLRHVRGGLGASLEVELREDRADIVLDGLVGQEDLGGDLLVRLALGDQEQDLLLL